MTFEFIWSVVTFSFGMSSTPGPNNTIAFSTGLNYGLLRVVPYTLGVSVGLPLMVATVALGLGEFLNTFPQSYLYIRYAGIAYILYLAWKIATALPPEKDAAAEAEPAPENERGRCPTFLNGVLFQWMNPKAWILAVTSTGVYLGKEVLSMKLAVLCGIFSFSCIVSVMAWGLAGALSGRLISSPRVHRILNVAMGLLLVSSIATMF